MATEHPLVAAARRATSDPSAHQHVAETMAALEPRLAAAVEWTDRETARTELRATLVLIQREIGRLVARSLIPGFEWSDAAHRRLFQRAVTLFGAPEATRLLTPPPEVLTLPGGRGGGPRSMFGL